MTDIIEQETNLPEDTTKRKRGRPKGAKSMKTVGKFTAKKKRLFLDHLKKCGFKSTAAAKVNMTRSNITYHEKKDPVFAEEIEKALLMFEASIDEAAYKRGVEGIDKPVWFQGKIVGYDKNYSDRMLEFSARTVNPEKYGQTNKVEMSGSLDVTARTSAKLALVKMLDIAIDSAEDAEYEDIED